jgi:hypothetical protein
MLVFKGGMSQVTSSYHKLPFVCNFFVEHSYPFSTLITIYFNRMSPLVISYQWSITTIVTHYMSYNNN